jgi:hypothetical protein
MLDKRLWEALTQEAVMSEPMSEKRLQWFKTLVAVHEPELGELFQEIDRLRSALTQPPRQSVVSDEIPYRGPFVFSAFGSGVALAQPAKKRDSRYPLGHYNNPMPSDDLDRKGGRDE